MTSDERVNDAFDTLAGRLREQIGQQVQGVLDELTAAALADRERAVAEARASAEREVAAARTSVEREAGDRLAAEVASAEARAREAAHAEGFVAGKIAGKDEGFAAGKDEGFKAGKDEGFAAGKDEGFTAGKEAGREEGQRTAAPRESPAPPDSASSDRLVDGIRSIGRARSLSDILEVLVGCAGREAGRAAVLLVRGGRFRAWKLAGFGAALDADTSLEFPFDEAGVLATAVQTNAVAAGDGGDAAAAPAFASLAAGQPCLAVPIALSGEVVAVLYADQGTGGAWMTAIEVLTRHAARSLEAMTAFKTARAIMDQPGAPDAADVPAPGANGGAPADEDASARRYARLLVSEIKLYHEAAVVAGRRDRDLGQRLDGEITRARVLYEQRVPPPVRQRADYFHDELVRTLANGDASLLEL